MIYYRRRDRLGMRYKLAITPKNLLSDVYDFGLIHDTQGTAIWWPAVSADLQGVRATLPHAAGSPSRIR